MNPRGLRQPHPSEEYVLETGFLAVEAALRTIRKRIANPDSLTLVWNYTLKKNLLKIDEFAQAAAMDIFDERLPESVEIRGEETSLADFTFTKPLAALLDMIDGTDLLERGLGNWCSAMAIFDPENVWASFIGMPEGEIYFVHKSDPLVYLRYPKEPGMEPDVQTVEIEKPDVRLKNASIAFYGQKPKSLLTTVRHKGFLRALDDLARIAKEEREQPGAPRFRIYNLAGNPMMMKLLEGKIDAVIELSGQKCHDVVPGFAIALKAGAVLYDLDTGKQILTDYLPVVLRKPKGEFRYVLACNQPLADEILGFLSQSN